MMIFTTDGSCNWDPWWIFLQRAVWRKADSTGDAAMTYEGVGVCGMYSKDVAETKVYIVRRLFTKSITIVDVLDEEV